MYFLYCVDGHLAKKLFLSLYSLLLLLGPICSELRSCVKVEVDVLGSPSLIVLWSLWT